jgi:hypothetical protein
MKPTSVTLAQAPDPAGVGHGGVRGKVTEVTRAQALYDLRLEIIEKAEFKLFGEFLTKLKGVKENGKHLLDHTAILFGSNLGNASSHNTTNLPVIVAGGGYKHGSYVAHDAKDNTPFCNLFVPLAQRMGVETEKFGSNTKSTIRGLES